MESMFYAAEFFNQDINSWNTAQVGTEHVVLTYGGAYGSQFGRATRPPMHNGIYRVRIQPEDLFLSMVHRASKSSSPRSGELIAMPKTSHGVVRACSGVPRRQKEHIHVICLFRQLPFARIRWAFLDCLGLVRGHPSVNVANPVGIYCVQIWIPNPIQATSRNCKIPKASKSHQNSRSRGDMGGAKGMGEIDIYGFRILVGAPCTVGLAMSSLGGPRYEL